MCNCLLKTAEYSYVHFQRPYIDGVLLRIEILQQQPSRTMALLQAAGILTGISCLFSICCVIFHAVAFGTRSWLEGDGISPFVRIGEQYYKLIKVQYFVFKKASYHEVFL